MKESRTYLEGKVLENRSRVVNNRTNRTNKTNKAAEYQYGSAVRKLQEVPEVRTYEPKRRDEEREQERRLRLSLIHI